MNCRSDLLFWMIVLGVAFLSNATFALQIELRYVDPITGDTITREVAVAPEAFERDEHGLTFEIDDDRDFSTSEPSLNFLLPFGMSELEFIRLLSAELNLHRFDGRLVSFLPGAQIRVGPDWGWRPLLSGGRQPLFSETYLGRFTVTREQTGELVRATVNLAGEVVRNPRTLVREVDAPLGTRLRELPSFDDYFDNRREQRENSDIVAIDLDEFQPPRLHVGGQDTLESSSVRSLLATVRRVFCCFTSPRTRQIHPHPENR